jgi:RNA polymerase sigma-70 factor, ECF subfamily
LTERTQAEFRALYRRHAGFVWRALRRFGIDASQLDDAAQEVFVVLHRRMNEIDPTKVAGFLYQTARRVASSSMRGRSRRERREADAPELGWRVLADEALQRNEAVRIVEGFLGTLSPEQAVAFELVELEGLTLREAAEILAENADTVATRVRRARAKFRDHLAAREDGDHA